MKKKLAWSTGLTKDEMVDAITQLLQMAKEYNYDNTAMNYIVRICLNAMTKSDLYSQFFNSRESLEKILNNETNN